MMVKCTLPAYALCVHDFASRLSANRQGLACGFDTVYTMYHKQAHGLVILDGQNFVCKILDWI